MKLIRAKATGVLIGVCGVALIGVGAADGKGVVAPKPQKAKAGPAAPPVAPAAIPTAAAPGVATASPLDGRPGTGVETAIMVEHPHTGKINLRGDAAKQPFLDAVKDAVGVAPPPTPKPWPPAAATRSSGSVPTSGSSSPR